jgi:DNA-binding CsgD family transcriptional regulator
MQGGHLTQARQLLDGAIDGGTRIAPRDEFLARVLEVALARRADDAPALVRAWRRARESALHVPVDLYSLLPLGELVIAAARMRDSHRLSSHLSEAWALLARLGNPPVWALPLHWAAVQAAILAERPREIAPHATALVRASADSRVANVLASAGRAWMAVLAGDFDVEAVETAAKGLASVGLPWDGSRLAGHAAAHAEDRAEMTRLLACARELHSAADVDPQSGDDNAPFLEHARPRPDLQRDETGLSAREREVARLVLEGKNYREIGEAIFISPRTVEHHVARIRQRLDAKNRSELLTELRLVLDPSEPHAAERRGYDAVTPSAP